jgi:Na+/melibiose symporter-like transporter
MGFKLVLFAGFAVHISAIPFYTRHVLGVSDSVLGTIFAVQTALMVLSQMAWVRLAARMGRRNALVLSGVVCTLAYLTWALIPPDAAIPMVFIAAAMSGAGTGGIFLGLYTVLTDTMDYSKRTQGEDRAGMLAGVFVMVEKGTSALGTFAFSMIMAWVGFQSALGSGAHTQPDGVRSGILASVALVPALGAVIATLIMTRYHLPTHGVSDTGNPHAPEPLST